MDTEQLKEVETLTIEAISVRKVLLTQARILDEIVERGIRSIKRDLKGASRPSQTARGNLSPKTGEP
jgi:hypothetical protein